MRRETKIIHVDGISFKMVLTSEDEGYYGTFRTYDLYHKTKRIAKDVGSIKSCYNKAYEFTLRQGKGI